MFIALRKGLGYDRARTVTETDTAAGALEVGFMRKRRRAGYSLAELILGAAVIAAFLVRIYQSYAATSAADKYQDFVQEMGLLNGTIHSVYINSPDFSGIDSDSTGASFAGNLPRKYVNAAGGIINAYKQPVTFASTSFAGTKDAFTMSTTMPGTECSKTAFGDMGRNLVSMTVAGQTLKFMDGTTGATTANSAITSAAQTACQAGGTGNIPVSWTFD